MKKSFTIQKAQPQGGFLVEISSYIFFSVALNSRVESEEAVWQWKVAAVIAPALVHLP